MSAASFLGIAGGAQRLDLLDRLLVGWPIVMFPAEPLRNLGKYLADVVAYRLRQTQCESPQQLALASAFTDCPNGRRAT